MNIEDFRRRLIGLPKSCKPPLLVLADMVLLSLVFLVSLWLSAEDFAASLAAGWAQLPLALAVSIPLFAWAGFYSAITRFLGGRALPVVTLVLVTAALVMAAARQWPPASGFALPSGTLPVFVALGLVSIVSSRVLMRQLLSPRDRRRRGRRVPVVVYGAGDAGMRLVASLADSPTTRVVAVVDDNPDLQGRRLAGVRICSPRELRRITRQYGVQRILLALPSISRERRQRIIEQLFDLNVRILTVPDISDIIAGRAHVDDLRDVDAVDLLGRAPVPPNEQLLGACITGKSVLVTGAGGSIGSELCRQIIRLRPARLVVLDISEIALYRIEQELRTAIDKQQHAVELVALLGSVHNAAIMRRVIATYKIQTIYHAAAYKHVPIVEQNMLEGVRNNVIGTWYTAEAAEAAGVETFVLVSTDKAVWPTSVMGASKRVAELVLQGMARLGTRTKFCMVRFGNVLDSSGSVVPLFREQIRRGGPVTLTHRDVTRYFMTIPEAAQLVIQAGSMSLGGDIFVLDMGEPVRIEDLARRMIKLMGYSVCDEENPGGDIELCITGLRPGEKLYEELLIGNDVRRTGHPKIMRALEYSLEWPATKHYLCKLEAAVDALDCNAVQGLLQDMVPEYQPESDSVRDLTSNASQGRLADITASTPAVSLPHRNDLESAPSTVSRAAS